MSDKAKRFIRLKRITMHDFRNIEYGKVDFPNADPDDYRSEQPSILGLYGQNGSGKTSLVMAVNYLKSALSGRSLDMNYNGCVREGCDHALLEYELAYWDENGSDLIINYSFQLSEKEKESVDRDGDTYMEDVVYISNESLSFSGKNADNKTVGKRQIDTSPDASKKGYAFGKDTMYVTLLGKNKVLANQMRELKAVCYSESRSFIFSNKLFDNFLDKAETELPKEILQYMKCFGGAYLHVIDNHTTGINNLNVALPLLIWSVEEDQRLMSASTLIRMGRHEQAIVPDDRYQSFCEAIDSFNEVLCQLVPGLSVEIQDFGVSKDGRGNDIHLFSLYSVRGGVKISLNCESDGIRRIISIMTLLIGVYNQPSMTVVIDEIDSGIYEYLLGEILRIMAGSAKGQLVFTSHNLRALEVLPSKYICFTSTNPEKRFVKITRSGNSNLRDQYYRMIVLGSKDEQVYNPTDNYEIELAFYNAGRIQDKTLKIQDDAI